MVHCVLSGALGALQDAVLAALELVIEDQELATPVGVCSPETAERLRAEVDDLVCVLMPEELVAVGLYFDDFRPVEDDEVTTLLERAAAPAVAV